MWEGGEKTVARTRAVSISNFCDGKIDQSLPIAIACKTLPGAKLRRVCFHTAQVKERSGSTHTTIAFPLCGLVLYSSPFCITSYDFMGIDNHPINISIRGETLLLALQMQYSFLCQFG